MLKRILTIVAVLLLLPALAAAGYGFIWWKVSTAADNIAQQISPFVQMKYGKVHVDLLETEVGLRQISLLPQGSSGDITVESLTLRAPSWNFLLDLEEQLNKGNMPDSFHMDLQGVTMDMNSDYAKDWAAMATEMQMGAPQGYDTLACGDLKFFGLSEVRKMGYGRILTNLSFDYTFDSLDQQLNFEVATETQGMMQADVLMQVRIATESLNVQTAMFAQPELQRFEVRYKDTGYNVRRNKFCAKLNEESVEQYREKYAALLAQRLKYEGWIIPQPLFEAMDSLNNPRASAYARIDIPQGLGPQSMVMIQGPGDLLNMLAPYAEVAGKPVSLDGLDWKMPDESERKAELAKLRALQNPELEQQASGALPSISGEDVVTEPVVEKAEKAKTAVAIAKHEIEKPKRKSFKFVKLSVLPKHIGGQVILRTYFGRKVKGKLLSVTSKEVTVLHRLVDGRGTATYPIARDKIDTVQLYH